MGQQPPTGPYQQMPQEPPRGGNPKGPDGPQSPYGQPAYGPSTQPQYGPSAQSPYSAPPQSPYEPSAQPLYAAPPQSPSGLPPRLGGRHVLRNTLIALGGLVVLLIVAGIIGNAVSKTKTIPGPTVTVTQTATVAGPAVTVSVTPTANAQGQATQISQDGVYVVGTDIPGGTWHTSGGSQCYEATLNSTNTSDIIDNNNFTGPDTVSLSGAKAFDISGGCTWTHEK